MYVLIMSGTRITVNPHSSCLMSRNSLLERGVIPEVLTSLTKWLMFVYELSGSCSHLSVQLPSEFWI